MTRLFSEGGAGRGFYGAATTMVTVMVGAPPYPSPTPPSPLKHCVQHLDDATVLGGKEGAGFFRGATTMLEVMVGTSPQPRPLHRAHTNTHNTNAQIL